MKNYDRREMLGYGLKGVIVGGLGLSGLGQLVGCANTGNNARTDPAPRLTNTTPMDRHVDRDRDKGSDLDRLVTETVELYNREIKHEEGNYKQHVNDWEEQLGPLVRRLIKHDSADLRSRSSVDKLVLASVFNNYGLVFKTKERHSEAVDMYSRSLELTPSAEQETVLLNRGFSLYKVGRQTEALADYEKALKLNPSNAKTQKWVEGIRSQLK